jgi:hypothetical protein
MITTNCTAWTSFFYFFFETVDPAFRISFGTVAAVPQETVVEFR